MNILFLTQWFQPEPFFKGLPFAKALKERGHNVEVLTGFPNYPGGKLYPGYRVRFYRKELMEGIAVHRVALYPSHDRAGIKRMLNYFSFALSALCFGPFLVNKPDVIYVYNLITLAWAAVALKKIHNCKIIYDVQDLWPESVMNSGMLVNGFLLDILKRWCRWAYGQADKIAVLSPGFKQALVERGVQKSRIEVIYNWCDESSTVFLSKDRSSFAEKWHVKDTFNVVFAGTMGVLQGLDTVLAAARLAKQDQNVPNLRFILVGGGTEVGRLKNNAENMHLDNVIFIPRQAPHEMGKIWAIADALLVHLVDEPLFRITIPSKAQAYMNAGKPVVMAVRGDAAVLVDTARAGVICPPENPVEMLRAIKQVYDMSPDDRKRLGNNGRCYYDRSISLGIGCEKFLKLFA